MTCDMISVTSSTVRDVVEQEEAAAPSTTTLPPSKTLVFDKGNSGRTATNTNYLTTSLLFEVSSCDIETKTSTTDNASYALNILDQALDCLDDASYDSSSSSTSFNSFIDEIQVPVKYDNDTTTTSNVVVPARNNSSPKKIELLLDDMRSFEDMMKNATTLDQDDDDVTSCCSDSEEDDEDDDDVRVPVKFDAPESSSSKRCIRSPRQREYMLDNMESFESMLDLYLKNPGGDVLDDDDLSDEEEEEEEDGDCCYYY